MKSINSKVYGHNSNDSSWFQPLDQWPIETIQMFQNLPHILKDVSKTWFHQPTITPKNQNQLNRNPNIGHDQISLEEDGQKLK
jgi:hypothetical protein